MRPFNLEEAKKGAKICTRMGQKAIIEHIFLDNSFSAKIKFNKRYMKFDYGFDGRFYGDFNISSPYDLMICDNNEKGENK